MVEINANPTIAQQVANSGATQEARRNDPANTTQQQANQPAADTANPVNNTPGNEDARPVEPNSGSDQVTLSTGQDPVDDVDSGAQNSEAAAALADEVSEAVAEQPEAALAAASAGFETSDSERAERAIAALS